MATGSKRIYIFGGFDGNKWLNDLHVLDVGRLEVRESSMGKFHENDPVKIGEDRGTWVKIQPSLHSDLSGL